MKASRLLLIAATLVALTTQTAQAAPPPGYCEVTICTKLERVTLSPSKWFKDKMGETCQPGLLAKADAVVDKKLDSSSRWYQGSFNPTKASVTRVKKVGACTPEVPAAGKAR